MTEKPVFSPSRVQIILYALPALPLAALTLPLYSLIPTFYAESLGLPLAGIGFALFIVRAFDAINDPVAGWLSDRWRPGFGRRRSVFAISLPVVLLGVWKVFWPEPGIDVWYLGFWTLVLSVGYTGCILSFSAWGAELDTSYKGRSRVAGWREGLTLVGTLVAISVPFSIGWENPNSVHGFAWLAVVIIVALPITAACALAFVPEPREHSHNRVGLMDGFRHIKGNAPFVRLAVSFFLNGFGNSIAATLFLLYCSDRLNIEHLRGPLFFAYFLAGVISVPFWTWYANRTSKHRAWCTAMVLAAIVFSPAPLLPEGSALAFGIICVLSGLTLGADITLPAAIQADVIDVDTARSGEQRSGIYFALWSLATKMSLAIAVFAVFSILDKSGFKAAAGEVSTGFGIAVLGYLYGWGPIALKMPAVALMWNFPLNQKEVEQLRHDIDRSGI